MHSHIYTHGQCAVFILPGVNPLHFTPYCSPFRLYACAALWVDVSTWYAFLSPVIFCPADIINKVCLCRLDRLYSKGYVNKLDCCLTREAETLNGAKDNPCASSFLLLFSLLELRLQSRVICQKKKKVLPGHVHSCCFGGWIYPYCLNSTLTY